MKKVFVVLLAVVSGFLFSGCGYNKMVEMDEQVASSWSQVENVYQRRGGFDPQSCKYG